MSPVRPFTFNGYASLDVSGYPWIDRYIRRFYDEGTLNTTRGHNAQEECQKIKGIGKIVTQVLCTANLLQVSGFVINIAFLGFIWPLKQPPIGCFSGRILPVL